MICRWCRGPNPPSATRRRVFCSDKCRVASHREDKRTPVVYSPSEVKKRAVAALYVRTDGIYPTLPLVTPYDGRGPGRDATGYWGPDPVVAHPPCAPWGSFRHNCTGQRADLAVRAVEQVRTFGGVLEHPSGSHLWVARELPAPGDYPDSWGGWSLLVRQSWWGHQAPKPTWLYIVGRWDHPALPPPVADPGGRIVEMDRRDREATPEPLARWLVGLAQGCVPLGSVAADTRNAAGGVTRGFRFTSSALRRRRRNAR